MREIKKVQGLGVMALNDRQIRNVKPKEKDFKLSDSGGLFLLVKPSGRKYWRLKYRLGGKEKLLAIGVYPDIGLAEARAMAKEAKGLLANGVDPVRNKQERRSGAEAEMLGLLSFEGVAREWHKSQLARWSEKHAMKIMRSLEVDAFPALGILPIEEITPPMVLGVIRTIEGRGAVDTAITVLQRIKAVFNYAVQTGRAKANPASSLSGVIAPMPVINQLALPQSELVEFYRRLALEVSIKEQTRIAMKLLMLTFVRAGELRHALWAEIDMVKCEWHIPAEKMKMRKPHVVPLSDWAMSLLEELKQYSGKSPYLFPSVRDLKKPMSENTLSYLMGRMGYKGIAVPHGFRSLATDVLNENDFDFDVIERQLAHQEQNKVRAAYHRTEYLPKRHEMMQWYSDWLQVRFSEAVGLIQSSTVMPKHIQP